MEHLFVLAEDERQHAIERLKRPIDLYDMKKKREREQQQQSVGRRLTERACHDAQLDSDERI